MKLPIIDQKILTDTYMNSFRKNGYSSSSVLWDIASKQDIRYDVLTSLFNFEGKSILDIGCGFGDLNKILQLKYSTYSYFGIDIHNDFLEIGREVYKDIKPNFILGDFMEYQFNQVFDYVVASGTFNFRLKELDQYEYIDFILQKAFEVCKEGLAFNFLSDRVNFESDLLFNYNPEKLLTMAYKLSRNVVLRSDYMPFDFSLFIFKDDSFDKDRVFHSYLNRS